MTFDRLLDVIEERADFYYEKVEAAIEDIFKDYSSGIDSSLTDHFVSSMSINHLKRYFNISVIFSSVTKEKYLFLLSVISEIEQGKHDVKNG